MFLQNTRLSPNETSSISVCCLLLLLSYFAYSSALKMARMLSFETSDSLRTTRHCKPWSNYSSKLPCENIKSKFFFVCLCILFITFFDWKHYSKNSFLYEQIILNQQQNLTLFFMNLTDYSKPTAEFNPFLYELNRFF
jgi:hypothetical protein